MQNIFFKKGLVFILIALFTLTSVVPSIVGQGEEYFYANQDITVQNGGISGDYTDTFSSDDAYEAISERESGGKPSNRYSYLEHKWTFELTSSYTSIDFYIEAYHTGNSEGDDFIFAYSTDDVDYTDILTTTKTSDDDTTQGASLPSSLTGTVYIRVKDTDQTKGNRIKDTIFIDYMCILAMTITDTTPPVISNVASSYDFTTGIELLTYRSFSDYHVDIWENHSDSWVNVEDLTDSPTFRIQVGNVDDDLENEIICALGSVIVWDYVNGEFIKTWNSTFIGQLWDVDIGDVDDDGKNEIIIGQGTDKFARIFKFNGTSYEQIWVSSPGDFAFSLSCKTGDITNDGKIDFVYNDGNTIKVYEYISGTFTNTYDISGAGNCDNIDIGDADNDGDNELIFCGADYKVHLVEWTGSGFEEVWDSGVMDERFVQDCRIGDVDTDGDNEIVGGGDEMYVWEFQSDTWNLAWRSSGYGGNNMKNINILDVDSDGQNEFTSADGVAETWHIWGHTTGNIYVEEFNSGQYGESIKVGAGDIDDDVGIQATITWDTDEPSDSVVNYGTTTELGDTTSDSSLVTNHQIIINGLLSDTTYFFEVQSTDASDNTATDDNSGDNYTFTTNIGPEISDVDSFINDDTWIKMNPIEVGGSIKSRERFGMVYDSTNDRTIAFGGWHWNPHKILDDTWAYNFDDNTWYNMSPDIIGGILSPRIDYSMAYDSTNDRTVLFGGSKDGMAADFKETWTYDFSNNAWYNMSTSENSGTLTKRVGQAMTYDSDAQRVILFGGWDGSFLNETWTYNFDDNTWYNMSPTDVGGNLPTVASSRIVYDSVNKVTVMCCGQITGYQDYNDETWTYNFNDNTWTKKNPIFIGGTLTGREMLTLAYDSNAEHVVLFGGQGIHGDFNDTWIYKTSVDIWYKCNPGFIGGTLWPREGSEIVYDSIADKIILFSGWSDKTGFTTVKDTWTFNVDAPKATIEWTTDKPSDSVVNYGTTTALGNSKTDSTLVKNHKINLIDLIPETTYYFEVQSTDQYGYTTIDNNNGNFYTFTTVQVTTPPVISNVQSSSITHNRATITWETDESSTSRVNYGTTTALGEMVSSSTMVTSHSITLSDLLSESMYYYEVESTNADGNTAVDDNNGNYYTFTTESEPNNVMHVYGIDMWYEQVRNKFNIFTEIIIVDASDYAVEGATVYIDTTLSNGDTISTNDVTDSTGSVTFQYGPTPKKGTYISTVTNVIKDGWTYNPNDNVETSETLSVP